MSILSGPVLNVIVLIAFIGPVTASDKADPLELLERKKKMEYVMGRAKQCVNQRDKAACLEVGAAFRDGYGFEKNHGQMNTFFKAACELREPIGCNELGVSYEYGLGVAFDYGEAGRLYHLACNAGYALACSNLGALYQRGFIRSTDPFLGNKTSANIYYGKACDGGVAIACSQYGFNLVESGNESDMRRSAWYFRKACNLGEQIGCDNLRLVCSWWTFPPSVCGAF